MPKTVRSLKLYADNLVHADPAVHRADSPAVVRVQLKRSVRPGERTERAKFGVLGVLA
jgi:hypothetical protein